MSAATIQLMTVEEFLALPDDGKRRWLHNGELREEGITTRNRFHSASVAHICGELYIWLRKQQAPRGEIVCGEAGVRFDGDAGSVYGVDAAYISPEVAAQQTDATTMIDGVPTLIVEILLPSTVIENIDE